MTRPFPVDVELLADGEYLLSWSEDFSAGPVRVRAHTEAEAVARVEPLVAEARGGARLVLDDAPRYYFHLEPVDGDPLTAAQRNVPLEGGTNFRDMGGYRAADGRRVRWGKLFRSGHSARLSESDIERVAALDIAVCCDFRRDEERSLEVSRLPARTRIVGLPIDPGSISSFFAEINAGTAGAEAMIAFMEYINREFVSDHTEQFGRMFEELLAVDGAGFMINCAAGKDRTGFGAAMILGALGVDEKDIVADYLLSERYYPIEREMDRIRRKYGGTLGRPLDVDLIMPMMQTRPSYLGSALQVIRDDYGTIENYLASRLGVGPAELRVLRDRYTE